MNILITSIGSFSAEAVIRSVRKFPVARIIGADINPGNWLTSALLVDEFYQV